MESTNALKTGWMQRTRYTGVFILLLAALFCITVLNVNIGSVPIPVSHIAKIIFTGDGEPTQVAIIWKIRLPRILMAADSWRRTVTCGLSSADVLCQSHSRTV